MAPSRYDWKIVDWDVKPQHNQPKSSKPSLLIYERGHIWFNVGWQLGEIQNAEIYIAVYRENYRYYIWRVKVYRK